MDQSSVISHQSAVSSQQSAVASRTSENDRVTGFESGADDYVTQPFSLRELSARVKAVLKRSARSEETHLPAYNGGVLTADFGAVAISVHGTPVRLTRREFELLRYLVAEVRHVANVNSL